jgi:hypothetical protein
MFPYKEMFWTATASIKTGEKRIWRGKAIGWINIGTGKNKWGKSERDAKDGKEQRGRVAR